jgi:hypothetical protein
MYGNITMKPLCELIYANKKIKKKKSRVWWYTSVISARQEAVRIMVRNWPWLKSVREVQLVECLPSKCKALSFILSITKKFKNKVFVMNCNYLFPQLPCLQTLL